MLAVKILAQCCKALGMFQSCGCTDTTLNGIRRTSDRHARARRQANRCADPSDFWGEGRPDVQMVVFAFRTDPSGASHITALTQIHIASPTLFSHGKLPQEPLTEQGQLRLRCGSQSRCWQTCLTLTDAACFQF